MKVVSVPLEHYQTVRRDTLEEVILLLEERASKAFRPIPGKDHFPGWLWHVLEELRAKVASCEHDLCRIDARQLGPGGDDGLSDEAS